MKKRILNVSALSFALFILVSLNFVSAINLDVTAKPIQNTVITDLSEPAIFELTIKNLGDTDNFEIYSIVGVDITPGKFSIASGETKTLQIKIMPQNSLESDTGSFTFEYKIKDSKDLLQVEKLTINILEIKDAILISVDTINPQSEKVIVTARNKINYDFKKVDYKMTSVFFDKEDSFLMGPLETKTIEITLNKDKLKTLTAGSYLLSTRLTAKGKSTKSESMIKFLEQEGIETKEVKEGFIIKREETTKTNVGNVVKSVKIVAQKNIFSYLFTTFNVVPTEVKRSGLSVSYLWEKELIPNEELKVVVKTNWFYPIIVIIFAIILFLLIKKYVESDLILRKHVSFVKTRGGEFALKITIKAKAKRFIEKISIIDRLPPLVKLYERYGAVAPDKIDLTNKRIEWNVESLNEREERIFSYIVYSKIGIVGKFELPSTKAIYEKEGKVKETTSNRSFYINEPKLQKM